MFTKDISKEKISTILGFLIMLLATSSYYFSFPHQSDLWVNLSEFLFGFMLLFIDGKKIADKVFAGFSKKVEG